MPPTNAPVLRAADLRLIHACAKIARVHFSKFADFPQNNPGARTKADDALRQLESVVAAEMTKHNIIPALSAQELRDEALTDDDIPNF